MNNHISDPCQLLVINTAGNTVISGGQPEHSLAPLLRTKNLFQLAMHKQGRTERYSIQRLADELRRQSRIIVENGDVAPKQKLQLHSLMLACMAELQAINVQLNDQLIEILLR